MNSELTEKAIEYNRDMSSTLLEMWQNIPKGIQKQILKNERIKRNLIRFHVIEEEKT